MRVNRASDGRANLHVWREGREYWCQKSPVFLKEWTNVQFSLVPRPADGKVNYHDLRQPLRFADNTFDAADASHVFEHLTPEEGRHFAGELYRVLKPGGVCRVSTPDLERICRDYLRLLEQCRKEPSAKNIHRYEWSVWEIFDQIVREKSGGRMLEALQRKDLDVEFIEEVYGDVFREFYGKATPEPKNGTGDAAHGSALGRLLARPPAEIPAVIVRKVKTIVGSRLRGREEIGPHNDPGKTGERVRWLYDRVSLRLLLEGLGFEKASVKTCAESDIAGWERHNLDQSSYGDYAIDSSVFVEARKPLASAMGTTS
jgi:predicted SAM-dependent methyltransferase